MTYNTKLKTLLVAVATITMIFITAEGYAYPGADEHGFSSTDSINGTFLPYRDLGAQMPARMPDSNPWVQFCTPVLDGAGVQKTNEDGSPMQSCVRQRMYPNAMTDAQRKEVEDYRAQQAGR